MEFTSRLLKNLQTVIVGKDDALQNALICLLSKGHLLLEDVPGTGKTTLAKALAFSLGGQYRRVQGTPDLLPTDITGGLVYNQKNSEFEFKSGPIFSDILLADEINRATPRAQSALLEAMAEGSVTVDGETRHLSETFMVLATMNPLENKGTFALPEAQMDRFMMRLSMGYPMLEHEVSMVLAQLEEHPIDSLSSVASMQDLSEAQAMVKKTHVSKDVVAYASKVVASSRDNNKLSLGASPRALVSWVRAAQAKAFLDGRAYVTPDDLQQLAEPVLAHRVILSPTARAAGESSAAVINALLSSHAVPV